MPDGCFEATGMSITVLLRIFRKDLTDALAGKLEIIKVMAVREYILHLTEINSNGYDNIFSQNFEMVSSRTSHIMLSRMRFSFGNFSVNCSSSRASPSRIF